MRYVPLEDRIGSLERRLERIERKLGLEPEGMPVQVEAVPPPRPPLPVEVLDAVEAAHTPPPLPDDWRAWEARQPSLRSKEPASPVLPYAAEPTAAEVASPRSNLEQAIGLKWAGWVGAVVLVIGAGLGIKFAYDQGWFSGLPPALRLTFMSMAGLALIGAGEWVYRRVNALSAAGLFGAGIAVLFLVSYAGNAYYNVYEKNTAYVLMALSTLIGAAVARRGNLVSIAVLALIGGNLAPLVLHGDASHLVGFLTYLLMLQVVALLLTGTGRGEKWWTLRIIALVTTSLWVWAALSESGKHETALLVFTLIYAGLFHAELILAAARDSLGRANDAAAAGESDLRTRGGAAFSIAVTGAAVAAVLFITQDATHAVRGSWVLGFSVACALLGFSLRRILRPAFRALSIGYRIQAATLLVVAVPVALAGPWVTVGWATLAVAFGVAARLLHLRVARYASVATWGLAVLQVAMHAATPDDPAAHAVWFTFLQHPVVAWAALWAALSLVGHGIAWLTDPGDRDPAAAKDLELARAAAVAATLVWLCVTFNVLPGWAATLMLVVYAWFLAASDWRAPRLGLAAHASVVLVLATLKWAFADLLAARLSPGWSAAQYAPVLNPAMGIGVFIAFSLAAFAYLRRASLLQLLQRSSADGERDLTLAVVTLVVLLIALGLSFEIDRIVERAPRGLWPPAQLKQFFWTMLWSVCSVLIAAVGYRIEETSERRCAWVRIAGVLPMLLAVKWLLVDTLLWRANGVTPAAVGVNVQTLAGVVVIAALVMVRLMSGAPAEGRRWSVQLPSSLAVLVLLLAGSLEIDRFFEKLGTGSPTVADPHLAKEVALSVFWSLFAILSVVAGFRFRAASLRYFGLGLFALTLLKIVVIDLNQVGRGYRILSFMGLGLLLLGTSVLYGKLSPRLLRGGDWGASKEAASEPQT